jgi:hypothetical protein
MYNEEAAAYSSKNFDEVSSRRNFHSHFTTGSADLKDILLFCNEIFHEAELVN